MSAAESLDTAPRLVDLLLAEQGKLRAVDEFSSWHADRHDARGRFETLIPGVQPGPGQQYAFAVDLDACTGCKACVAACHGLNGLEPEETWRKVGEVEASPHASDAASFRQTITTACHHCESPACLAGCPVRAYEKDPGTGVVIHLDDQCIGCRYCQLMCPYDVPQYSERLGIVRKCDLCHGRLAAGEAPACVQGCPSRAISIALVDTDGRAARAARPHPTPADPQAPARDAMLLPMLAGDMPSSALTRPTTVYRSERAAASPTPAVWQTVEAVEPEPAQAHEPLAMMLVLTQAAVGTLVFDQLLRALMPVSDDARAALVALVVAAAAGFAGLGASVSHLGRPLWAFRAFLGLRTSWLSREIVVFGAFAASLAAALAATALGLLAGDSLPSGALDGLARLAGLARGGAIVAGLAGVVCSIQIYAVTGRPLWRLDRTALRFVGTTALLGAAGSALAWSLAAIPDPAASPGPLRAAGLPLGLVVLVAACVKLRSEGGALVHGRPGHDDAALARTRILLARGLAGRLRARRMLGIAFGVAMPIFAGALAVAGVSAVAIALAFGACFVGCIAAEALERSLFFRSEAMRGMPGTA